MGEKQYWYLDTEYLLSYLSGYGFLSKRTRKELWKNFDLDEAHVRQAISAIKHISQDSVKVPIITWAEAITQFKEKNANIGIIELMSDFETAWLRRDEVATFSEIISFLIKEDGWLDPFDCLIVAFAIAKNECCGLLTFDSNIIQSITVLHAIQKYIGSSRPFIITEYPARQ